LLGCAPYIKNDSEDDHKQNGRQFLIPSPLVPVLIEEILLHCAHAAGRQALAKIRATAWARQGVRFDRLFTGGALDPGGGKVDPPRSVKRDGADDDHDEDKPVHSLPLIAVGTEATPPLDLDRCQRASRIIPTFALRSWVCFTGSWLTVEDLLSIHTKFCQAER
jgi:hypothetical protein